MPRNLITSDLSIRSIKPGDSRRRLSDGDGLYLLLFVKGGAHGWRFDYSIAGKRKTISMGTFPDVLLSAARKKADEARALVASGVDPSAARKEAKTAARAPAPEAGNGTFRAVTDLWLAHQRERWNDETRKDILNSLENHVFEHIGWRHIRDIKAKDVLEAIRKTEQKGVGDMASRVLQRVKSVFRYAIVEGIIETNPTLDLKAGEILRPRRVVHRAALPIAELPDFLAKLDAYQGDETTVNALRLMLLTTARPGEVRGAMWSEVQGDVWRIPAERMKMPREHVIPLTPQAIAVIDRMRPLSSADPSGLVFPSPFYPGKALSENTLNSALSRMGYKGIATAHGFRAVFSTAANEAGWDGDVIERQLAHEQSNQVRAAYHRAAYMEERAKLLRWWADFIDQQRAASKSR